MLHELLLGTMITQYLCSASAMRCQETKRKNIAVKSLNSTAQTLRSVYRMEDDTYPKKVWQTRQEENVRHPKNLGKGIQKMIKGK